MCHVVSVCAFFVPLWLSVLEIPHKDANTIPEGFLRCTAANRKPLRSAKEHKLRKKTSLLWWPPLSAECPWWFSQCLKYVLVERKRMIFELWCGLRHEETTVILGDASMTMSGSSIKFLRNVVWQGLKSHTVGVQQIPWQTPHYKPANRFLDWQDVPVDLRSVSK